MKQLFLFGWILFLAGLILTLSDISNIFYYLLNQSIFEVIHDAFHGNRTCIGAFTMLLGAIIIYRILDISREL